ncbi:hypothetical protein N566_16385 [Streptomycetaceae bacterium MP113-05]|nr:hypothetical protein N566_16385 [Streptomycetaceae bacterium MP113-05]
MIESPTAAIESGSVFQPADDGGRGAGDGDAAGEEAEGTGDCPSEEPL